MRALVAGWFSFEEMGATAGDIMARDVACDWLERAGYAYDIAVAKPFVDGVHWREVDPAVYSHVVFVCGPCANKWPLTDLLDRFKSARLIGLDLTMMEPVESWNPFDLLFERDSSTTTRPDLSLLAKPATVPVVGVALVHEQKIPGAMHERANKAIERLIAGRELAVVRIDTRLDVPNTSGLRTPAEIESLIAVMDVVVTTRLHGTVLALKHGVPALAVDPIAAGHKIARQVRAIEWPALVTADQITDEALSKGLEYCLSEEARAEARRCAARAIRWLEDLEDEVVSSLKALQQT